MITWIKQKLAILRSPPVTGTDFKVTINGTPLEKFKGSVIFTLEPIDVLGKLEVVETGPKIEVKDV